MLPGGNAWRNALRAGNWSALQQVVIGLAGG
jgi:hypothetical protein